MSNINVNTITPLAGTSGTVNVSGSLKVSGSVTANGNIILGDLGLSLEKTKTDISSIVGTPEFMAPELYEGLYSDAIDIYSFGLKAIITRGNNVYGGNQYPEKLIPK